MSQWNFLVLCYKIELIIVFLCLVGHLIQSSDIFNFGAMIKELILKDSNIRDTISLLPKNASKKCYDDHISKSALKCYQQKGNTVLKVLLDRGRTEKATQVITKVGLSCTGYSGLSHLGSMDEVLSHLNYCFNIIYSLSFFGYHQHNNKINKNI